MLILLISVSGTDLRHDGRGLEQVAGLTLSVRIAGVNHRSQLFDVAYGIRHRKFRCECLQVAIQLLARYVAVGEGFGWVYHLEAINQVRRNHGVSARCECHLVFGGGEHDRPRVARLDESMTPYMVSLRRC